MATKPKILVTSAAGKTGLQVSLQLLRKGIPVRALVRRTDSRSEHLGAEGAEIVVGNQNAIGDMHRAMAGVQRAYHCAPTAPNALHFGTVFAEAAVEHRLEHTVMLGQWLSSPEHPSIFTRETWLNEKILNAIPGMTLTVVNPGWFADNFFLVLEPIVQLGRLAMPLGPGDEKKDAPPSNEAIAAVAVGALLDPERHSGARYRPTGPELISPNDVAMAFTSALGRKVRYQDISEKMFLKALAAFQPPSYSDAAVSQLRIYADEYRRGTFAVGGPTDVVQTVGQMPPEPFAETAARILAARANARRTFGSRVAAMANFAKILRTRAPDPESIERQKDYIRLAHPEFCQDSRIWMDRNAAPPLKAIAA